MNAETSTALAPDTEPDWVNGELIRSLMANARTSQ